MPNKRLQCIFTYYKSQYRLLLLQIGKYVTNYLSHLFNIIIIGLKGVLKAMNKKAKTGILALISATIILLAMSCEIKLIEKVAVTDVSGKVVNSMTTGSTTEYWMDGTNSLSGATLSFYAQNADGTYSTTVTTTATVLSNGSYTRTGIAMGKYKIQGSKTGWVFVPRYIDITGKSMSLPPVIAYPDQGDDIIAIILSWEDSTLDLDAILTYYDDTTPTKRKYVGHLDTYLTNANITTPDIDKAGTVVTSGNANIPISKPRDIESTTSSSLPRIETILIKWSDTAPYKSNTGNIGGVLNNQLRYYINGYDGSLTGGTTVPFSDAQVDVMYTDWNGIHTHKGGWTTPWNSNEKVLNIVNISVDSTDGFVIYSGNGSIFNYTDSSTEDYTLRSTDNSIEDFSTDKIQ